MEAKLGQFAAFRVRSTSSLGGLEESLMMIGGDDAADHGGGCDDDDDDDHYNGTVASAGAATSLPSYFHAQVADSKGSTNQS